MKKTTLLVFAFLSIQLSFSQIDVAVDANENWIGFVNVFHNENSTTQPDGTFETGFAYDVALIRTDINTSDGSVTVFPNYLIWRDNDETPCGGAFCSEWNPFWFASPEVPNKDVELNTFVERNRTDNPEFFNQDVTFNLAVTDFGFTPPESNDYVIKAFIKVFPADFSSVRQYDFILTTSGTFSVTAPAAEFVATDQVIQWGFQVFGPIADEANEPALRAVTGIRTVDPASLSTDDLQINSFLVSPNPTKNIWNIEANVAVESVEIFDLLGKNVLSLTPNSQNVSVDASNLKTGVYLARVTSSGGTKSLKLVKN
ncbi:T9SS type A sorting domain-containing protein [Winogradskyella litorisediminis]|uniref:T9SS type A sorting domain-containing protein n=1 Tax=Winogradskyella litorisediminis TaxID=1156618 RepID=A0ABW3N712_9FLAO